MPNKAAEVAVVVVAHAPLGSALRVVAQHVFGEQVQLTAIDVLPGASVEDSTAGLLQRLSALDAGAGVLILTDLPGASPANICVKACAIARSEGRVCDVLAGVNASMVLRALNYASSDMADMVRNALEGARQTIKLVD